MPSPFPGMDPYLEGYLGPDLHATLASRIRQQLTPKLRPHYIPRLEIFLVEDPNPAAEVGILYPDVEILQIRSSIPVVLALSTPEQRSISTTPAPLTLPRIEPVSLRMISVEIRDAAQNTLVTSIEIPSPVNGLSGSPQSQRSGLGMDSD